MTQLNIPAEISSSNQQRKRDMWIAKRLAVESTCYKHNRKGIIRKSHWSLFEGLIQIFGIFLKILGLYKRGVRNAQNIIINEVVAEYPDLPESFQDYKILHLTDLHLDFWPDFEHIIAEKVKGMIFDLCVITGDYRKKTHNGFHQIIKPMERIIQSIRAKDGIYATLGNHDTCEMVEHLEEMGIILLANETITLQKQKDALVVTGIDDPHYYFTSQVISTLSEPNVGFKILLVHTPELYDIAADNGYRLYLCGHTHGGQICVPGGIPIITHLNYGKDYYHGLWQYGQMLGYTSSGCGSVGIPVRFNSQGEIAIIKLKKTGYHRSGTVKKLPR